MISKALKRRTYITSVAKPIVLMTHNLLTEYGKGTLSINANKLSTISLSLSFI